MFKAVKSAMGLGFWSVCGSDGALVLLKPAEGSLSATGLSAGGISGGKGGFPEQAEQNIIIISVHRVIIIGNFDFILFTSIF
jgi:hypothetical protein